MSTTTSISKEKALSILEEASKSHGYAFWAKAQKYSCKITDEFYGSIGKVANPLSGNLAEFQGTYEPRKTNGSLAFKNADGNTTVWAYDNDQVLLNGSSDNIPKKVSKNIEFWIPTYQYFIEFPYRIVEATAVDYINQVEYKGEKCHQLIVSWNTVEPQKDIDQYMIWINENNRIVRIDYTIRDQYKFITGTAVYQEYIKFQGFDVPTEIEVFGSLTGDKPMHHMSFSNYALHK